VPAANLNPRLRFWHWWSFGCSDYGQVQITTNNGMSWLNLTNGQYSATSSGVWAHPQLDLIPYAGQTVRLGFYIYAHSTAYCSPDTSAGWYVDDLALLADGLPPFITVQPTNQTVHVESPASFTVSATGTDPLSYQWRSNGVPILNATNTVYSIASTEPNYQAGYDVVITNIYGSATSIPPATLTVLTLPGQLTNVVVDPVTPPGNAGYTNQVFTITGSGEDIQGTADAFEFVCEPLTGDGQIVARVTSLVGADAGAEAGVMIRESLDAGSPHAFLRINATTNMVFRRRLATSNYSIDTASSVTNHNWLRLMRMGNNFIGLSSTNGTSWEYVWFTTINMSNQVQVGLAVTAHHNALYATATVDNVSIGSLTALPTWPLSGAKILMGGEAGGMAEFQRVGGLKFLLGSVSAH
jgi:hypothetical protein